MSSLRFLKSEVCEQRINSNKFHWACQFLVEILILSTRENVQMLALDQLKSKIIPCSTKEWVDICVAPLLTYVMEINNVDSIFEYLNKELFYVCLVYKSVCFFYI